MRLHDWLRALACGVLAFASMSGVQAQGARDQLKEFRTTVDYVTHFYPLWFTYYQSTIGAKENTLAGPNHVTPIYKIVVAINVDTYYASSFLNMADGPVMLTIPATNVSYSILTLDHFGDTLNVGLPKAQGVYALTPPGYSGDIPPGTTRIDMPYSQMVLIFRADKYSSTGESEKAEAKAFREQLKLQPLAAWESNPDGGATSILSEVFFSLPYKTQADKLAATQPVKFLKQLQVAVAANTAQLGPAEQKIAATFDTLFGDGTGDTSQFEAGTVTAHRLILDDYLNHTDANNWINFTNMGTWKPSQFLDRSAITEFIQYGNNFSTAAYFQAFKDRKGAALDGSGGAVYALHIPKRELPDAQRFWSFTAYTPDAIELIRNRKAKYNVASYTPGLVHDRDGGVTLYFSKAQPKHVPEANWLPVSDEPFNIMLRVYGPEGNVAAGTYVPPPIVKLR